MKTETKTIELENISEASWNTRSEISEASVKALAESIKADGLLQPLNVIPDETEDHYICFDGCRRLNALRLLGAEEAPCRVWDITEAEAKVKTVTANIQREDDDPILAANVIGELLADGEKPEQIASKLGKTTPWVRRRAKLCALAPEVAEKIVGKVTLDALEKIAVMPPNAQRNLVKAVENRVKYANSALVTASDIRCDIQREQADLDGAAFNTKPCKRCEKRTGAQPDLWGETDGKLGSCLDCACYKTKVKEHEDALVAEATKGVKEVERVDGYWAIPRDADADKPTKKKPCAYAFIDTDDDGNTVAVVKYGPSRAEIDAAREAEQRARDAEREAESAEQERNRTIKAKFTDTMQSEERDDDVRKAIGAIIGKRKSDEDQRVWIIDLIANNWSDLWSDDDIAEVLRIFTFTREICGISDEDAKWFIERNAPEAQEAEEG